MFIQTVRSNCPVSTAHFLDGDLQRQKHENICGRRWAACDERYKACNHYEILILILKFQYRDPEEAPVGTTVVRASCFRGTPKLESSKISRGFLQTGLRSFSDLKYGIILLNSMGTFIANYTL